MIAVRRIFTRSAKLPLFQASGVCSAASQNEVRSDETGSAAHERHVDRQVGHASIHIDEHSPLAAGALRPHRAGLIRYAADEIERIARRKTRPGEEVKVDQVAFSTIEIENVIPVAERAVVAFQPQSSRRSVETGIVVNKAVRIETAL